jgi:hypothetical protein
MPEVVITDESNLMSNHQSVLTLQLLEIDQEEDEFCISLSSSCVSNVSNCS